MADELRINRMDVMTLQPGDIIIVDCGTRDPDELEMIADAINRALIHAGREEDVSALMHDGTISVRHVRIA